MGLFGMLEEDTPGRTIVIPKMPELSRTDMMNMEKETTGLYLTGHPMDDYRGFLKNTHVVPIAALMDDEEGRFSDDQTVSVAGIVQAVKMKSTRNNSTMAYVTLEDDTAAMEMLAFSNVLSQFGGYLKENSAVVVTGRLSLRDDKEPQILINRARPISDFAQEGQTLPPEQPQRRDGTLYLRLPSESHPDVPKVKAILNMFPGDSQVVLFFADTRVRRGTRCDLMEKMIDELKNRLGEGNVVLK